MYPFVVLIVLALGLSVLHQTLDELLPFRTPAALTRTLAVVIAAGLAFMLNYSAFAAFGQDLRAEWMHPVMTGLVLIASGELVRAVISALAHRAGEPPVETELASAGSVPPDHRSHPRDPVGHRRRSHHIGPPVGGRPHGPPDPDR